MDNDPGGVFVLRLVPMMLPSGDGGLTTQEVGFFEYEHEGLARWLRDGLGDGWSIGRASWQSLGDAVGDLAPTVPLDRYACIDLGGWTLMLNNGPAGTDVGVIPELAESGPSGTGQSTYLSDAYYGWTTEHLGVDGTEGGVLLGEMLPYFLIPGGGLGVCKLGLRTGRLTAGGLPRVIKLPKINWNKQGKHVSGHRNYDPKRSLVTEDPDVLVRRAGSGAQVGSVPRGTSGFKERIDYGEVIGIWVSADGKIRLPTAIGMLHYQADGAVHIVPARPR